jgi:hypothetical protein
LAYADEFKTFKGKYFEGIKEIPSSEDSNKKRVSTRPLGNKYKFDGNKT